MYILGINAYHGDAAAALIKDGKIVAAVEEERFNRIKHCAGFPARSIEYCLREAGIRISEVDHIGISRDPSAHLYKKVLAATRRLVDTGHRAMAGIPRKESQHTTVIEAEASDAIDQLELKELATLTGYGNGNRGARKLVDRLKNAAKVRDLK